MPLKNAQMWRFGPSRAFGAMRRELPLPSMTHLSPSRHSPVNPCIAGPRPPTSSATARGRASPRSLEGRTRRRGLCMRRLDSGGIDTTLLPALTRGQRLLATLIGSHMIFIWCRYRRPRKWGGSEELRSAVGRTCTSPFGVPDFETVARFHEAAIAAGYRDNGPPGERARSTAPATTERLFSTPTPITSRPSSTTVASHQRKQRTGPQQHRGCLPPAPLGTSPAREGSLSGEGGDGGRR